MKKFLMEYKIILSIIFFILSIAIFLIYNYGGGERVDLGYGYFKNKRNVFYYDWETMEISKKVWGADAETFGSLYYGLANDKYNCYRNAKVTYMSDCFYNENVQKNNNKD